MSSSWRFRERRPRVSLPARVLGLLQPQHRLRGSTAFQEQAIFAFCKGKNANPKQPSPELFLSQTGTCSAPGAFLLEISSCSDLSHRTWQGRKGLEANEFRKPAEHQAWADGHLSLSLLKDPP